MPGVDLLVTAATCTRLGEVRRRLLEAAGAEPTATLSVGRAVGDVEVVGRPPLLDTAVLTVSQAGDVATRPARATGVLELHVTAGPDAGQVHPLTPGRHALGRSPTSSVTVVDNDVSRTHAWLDVTPPGVRVSDAGSTNGTSIDGRQVDEHGSLLPLGSELRVGSSVLVLRLPEWRRAAVTVTGRGTLDVNRPPRARLPIVDVRVDLPLEPEKPQPSPFPLLAVVLPVLVSIPLALLWSPFALLFGLTTPVMMLANLLSDRRSGRRRYRSELDAHGEALSLARARTDSALVDERRRRQEQAPDAATVLTAVASPTPRLWERRPGDDDFLSLRLGCGTVSSRVTEACPGAGGTDPRAVPLNDAPVTVSLPRVGAVGVAGARSDVDALVRHLVAQVAGLHSPQDVRVAVLATDSALERWAWARWLPHARCPLTDDALVATDVPSVAHVAGRLRHLLQEREAADAAHRVPVRRTCLVVVLDAGADVGNVPGVAELLAHGPAVGIHTVAIGAARCELPGDAGATVEVTGEAGGELLVHAPGADAVTVRADLVSLSWAERFARCIGPLRDGSRPAGEGGVPEVCHLLEVLERSCGTDPLDASAVVDRWQNHPRCTSAVLGEHAGGVYAPDLVRDGPHVLVGGTTGAGKSELLQSLIAGLALVNRPDELAFLLIDYKGGAAFGECAELPHAVGLVTDLDEHLTRRTLTSLAAEIRRREQVLRDAGVKDLDDYQRLVDVERLPRLVIVVDEFRVLAEELPDFVSGLVRLAAVGRSLGLHLVLATQRPSGAVSPEIRANVNLRIALRMRDAGDSVDVVDSPSAATIDPRRPGRALARSGPDELVELQVARIAGCGAGREPTEVTVQPLGWQTSPTAASPDAADGPTDLARLVATLRRAAEVVGAAPRPPWLPPLPSVLHADEVIALSPGTSPPTALAIGLVDEPELMRRRPLVLDPSADGALAVAGANRSGRTGVLLALGAAVARTSPDDLHLYVLGAGPELTALTRLPHTGAVVRRAETERAARALRRIADEVSERRERGSGDRASVLVLVDGWDALQRELEDVDGGVPVEHLLHVLREGGSVGVMAVVTGDRTLLTGRVAGLFGARLLLRPADPTDLLLAGVHAKDAPTMMPAGRGLLLTAGDPVEVQVCLADPVPDTSPDRHGDASPRRPPFLVPPVPERVALVDVLEDPRRAADEVLLGVGGDEVVPLGLQADECRALVVAGPPGSGRSATLAVLAVGLLAAGRRVVLVRTRPSPAHRLVPDEVEVVDADDPDALAAVLSPVAEAGPVTVLVDDAEAVEGTSTEALLLAHLRAPGGGVVVAGGAAELGARFRGLAAELRRARTGVLLSPTGYADGDVLGVTVPRVRTLRPGRGHLVRAGAVQQLQVATVEAPDPRREDRPVPAPRRTARHADPHAERVPHPPRRTW